MGLAVVFAGEKAPRVVAEAEPVAPEAAVEAVEEVKVEAEEKGSGKRRARHPAGHKDAGRFIADDPATPDVNEAYE